jgi:hypothetical protein
MKKISVLISFFSIIILSASNSISAQETKQAKEEKKEAHIKSLIDQQHYSFEAQTAIPIGMRTRQLTPGYKLSVRKDTVEAYLPYYGKAYTATIGSSDGGINFKTTDFTYTSTPAKKGGWNITINLKKAGDTRQIMLWISSAGYGSLQVISNNKQSISFSGYVE